MNKKLKEHIIRKNEEMKAAFPNLYDMRWVEKAATAGFQQMIKDIEKVDPSLAELARRNKGYNLPAVIYYSAFESALNTFFMQCLEDTMHNVNFYLDELQNLTAELKEKES